eukprot:6213455-Pleurochrysis_carterae.AAC.1
MGEWRYPFCRMVDYSGEWLGLYSPNVKQKRFYRMVTSFCRMVNTILQNSLYIMFRYGERVILQNGDANATEWLMGKSHENSLTCSLAAATASSAEY